MDYASLQAELRKDALAEARHRAESLRARLAQQGAQRSGEAEREVRYLGRVAAVVKPRGEMAAFGQEVQELSARYAQLPLARRSVGAIVEELKSGAAAAAAPSSPTAASSASATPGAVEAARKALEQCPSFRCARGALAAFLWPGLPEGEGADEVRLLALEGRLVEELLHHSRITDVGAERTVFLRSWDGDGARGDDAGEAEVVAMSFSPTHGAQVLDTLRRPAKSRGSSEWLVPALAFAIGVGTAAILHVPTGISIVAATSTVTFGAKALEKWQEKVIGKMKEQLPKALEPACLEDSKRLQEEACRQERQLLQALADRRSWKPYWFSLRARRLGLQLLCQQSAVRSGGYAFATHFQTEVPARRVHALLERLSMTGSLDPGCRAVWARPVDDMGTSVRYLVFSNPWAVRDFCLVCRSGRAEANSGYVQPAVAAPPARPDEGPPPLRCCCRDRTEEFRRSRARRSEGCAEAPWRERLLEALEGGRVKEVLRIRDAAQEDRGETPMTCEDCHAVALAPRQGMCCEVCLRRLCDTCRFHEEDVSSLLRESSGPRPPRLVLRCCGPCGRFLGGVRWRRQGPPACLPASAAKLSDLHQELASGMTELTSMLAQLDGLHRILSGPEGHLPALAECWKRLPVSRDAAEAATTRLEETVRKINAAPCQTPNERTLRERLWNMGREHLDKLKPGLTLAMAAADECLERCPGFSLGLSSWTPNSSLAERYALSMASCPSHLLSIAGEDAVPVPSEGIRHGSIHLLGIVATDVAEGGSRVDVMADVDPDLSCMFLVDYDLRGHVLYTADRLRRELQTESKRLQANIMAELDALQGRLPTC